MPDDSLQLPESLDVVGHHGFAGLLADNPIDSWLNLIINLVKFFTLDVKDQVQDVLLEFRGNHLLHVVHLFNLLLILPEEVAFRFINLALQVLLSLISRFACSRDSLLVIVEKTLPKLSLFHLFGNQIECFQLLLQMTQSVIDHTI